MSTQRRYEAASSREAVLLGTKAILCRGLAFSKERIGDGTRWFKKVFQGDAEEDNGVESSSRDDDLPPTIRNELVQLSRDLHAESESEDELDLDVDPDDDLDSNDDDADDDDNNNNYEDNNNDNVDQRDDNEIYFEDFYYAENYHDE